ncbi:MAG: ABC transporter permease [bacterium]
MKSETKIAFFLAWKFLQRGNKWTLLLIIFLMAIAFINLVFITSLFDGIVKGTNDQVINTHSGHILMVPSEGEEIIANQGKALKQIESTPGVVAASAQNFIPASLKYQNISGNWQVLAIDPSREKQVLNVSEHMIAGEYLSDTDMDQIIIGRQIAGGQGVENDAFSFKDAKVGDKVQLTFAGGSHDLTIKGIFYTKFIDTDQRAFITTKTLDQLMPDLENTATSISIRIDRTGNEEVVINRLEDKHLSGRFFSWQEVSGLMDTVAESFIFINALLTTVGILIAAVTIFIVIYIDISSRRQQIGVLRAIGIKSYLIRSAYVIQTAVYSVFGVLLGAGILFAVLVPYFNAHPFELPIGDSVLSVRSWDFIFRAELIIWVAIGSGLIPATMITRVKILNAIFNR